MKIIDLKDWSRDHQISFQTEDGEVHHTNLDIFIYQIAVDGGMELQNVDDKNVCLQNSLQYIIDNLRHK